MIPLTCRLALAAVLVCLALPLRLAAQEQAPSSSATFTTSDPTPQLTSPSPSPPDKFNTAPGLDAVGKLLLYFALIAAAGGAVVYVTRHGIPFRRPLGSQDRKLQILEMRPLGNKQFLIVVAYEDTRILLGVTPGKIDYLCPLDSTAPDAQTFGSIMSNQSNPSTTL